MKTDHDGFLQFPTVKLTLTREEAKLLRRILACSTWDIRNLSFNEQKLITELHSGLTNYLVHSDHEIYKEQNRIIQCGKVRAE